MDLSKINLGNLKVVGSSMTYKQMLGLETMRFMTILKKNMSNALNSYTPKQYDRTWTMYNSGLVIENIFIPRQLGKRLYIDINFDSGAYGDSYWSGGMANKILLHNYGWSWKTPDERYHLSYFEGSGFIEKSIQEFESSSKYGVTVELNIPDKWYGL